MQGGLHAANTIKRRLHGDTRSVPFSYRDLGSVATIGRFRAVCSVRGIRLSGFPAWIVWLFVHLAFLNGFGNRFATIRRWMTSMVGRARPERVFSVAHTGGDLSTPASVRAVVQPTQFPAQDDARTITHVHGAFRSPSTRCRGRARRWRSRSAFHIILVPLGVSWAFMALVANYRAIKHDDADALLLAQRWSKYMAVTFAVGAVTGTVLTFEFGLLWPKFMGKFGAAFGIPFAIEGLFFFTEAIFIAIYIYGWKRLKPWPHFWTGVPIVIAGIGGTVSVVAANSWMNEPAGFTLNSAGKVVDVDPWSGDLQQGDAVRDRAHARRRVPRRRVPHRVGVRGRDAARPARPLPPARLHHPVHRRRDRRRRSRWSSATRSPGGSTTTSRPSSRRIELVPKTASDVPETLFGHLNSKGQVIGGIADPGPGVVALRSEHGNEHRGRRASTRCPAEPATDRRRGRTSCTWRGTSWSGSATLLFLLSAWYGAVLAVPARHARRRSCSCWHRRRPPASLSVVAHGGRAGSSPRSVANRGSSTTT